MIAGSPVAAAVQAFNALPASDCTDLLRDCLDIPEWIAAVRLGRPYDGLDSLMEAAREAGRYLPGPAVLVALDRHPRIGEQPIDTGVAADWSRQEQAGVDKGHRDELRAANARYEKTFGHIFLIRAAGRNSEEILAELERRMQHDPVTELDVVADELTQIACLRLTAAMASA